MTKARLKTFIAAALATTVLTAAGGAYAQSEVKNISIAYSVDVLDETQSVALQFMLDRVEELNAERDDIHVTFDTYDARNSVDKQISDVQTALIKSPDVVIISAVDALGSLPAAEAAKEAGVKVIDRRPTDPEPDAYDVAFFAYDESRYGATTTEWMKTYLDENPDVTLKIGLIYGAPAQTAQLMRCDAVKALAAEMPDRVQIVAEGYGNWLTDTAQNLTQDWLLAHPDMNFVVAANDIMALGASNALLNASRQDVMVSGYDLTADGLQRIEEGVQTLDVGTSLASNGQIVDVAVGLVEGTFTDDTYYITPVYAVDADSIAAFRAETSR